MTATDIGTRANSAARVVSCPTEKLPQVADALLADFLDSVSGALSATVVTVTAGRRLRQWARSGPVGCDLDAVQAAADQGPVFDAATGAGVVVSGDVWADDRWKLVPAGEAMSIRSVLSAPLCRATKHQTVLTVHGTDGRLAHPQVVEQVALALPELAAAVAVLFARREEAALREALASNRVIGAAIGVAMAARKLTYDAADELLRAMSDHADVPMADLAQNILLTGELPSIAERSTRVRRPDPRT